MEDIYIIGASGFAKEVYSLIVTEKRYIVRGFIDFKPQDDFLVFKDSKIPIIDEDTFLNEKELYNSNVAIGIGSPKVIETIFKNYKNYKFPNIISSKAIIGIDVEFGKGNIVTQNVIFTTHIKVGDGNIFNLSSTIGHDCAIGNFNVVNPSVNISGGVIIEDKNLLGVGCIILQYLNIGSNNVIGGSSLVTKNVNDSKLIIGVPGRSRE